MDLLRCEIKDRKRLAEEIEESWSKYYFLRAKGEGWLNVGTSMYKEWLVEDTLVRDTMQLRSRELVGFEVTAQVALTPWKGETVAGMVVWSKLGGWNAGFCEAVEDLYKEDVEGSVKVKILSKLDYLKYDKGNFILLNSSTVLTQRRIYEIGMMFGRDCLMSASERDLSAKGLQVASRWVDKMRAMAGTQLSAREVYEALVATTFTLGVKRFSRDHHNLVYLLKRSLTTGLFVN